MKYHLIAFIIGIALDCIVGDPISLPHPIRLIGKLIAVFDKKLNAKDSKRALEGGIITAVTVPFITGFAVFICLFALYKLNTAAGIALEAIFTYYILAARSLYNESMCVYKGLIKGDVEEARRAVSMIVGRDTKCLTADGITRAAVETVAENTSDGVIAPLIYTAIGGPVLGFIYKAVNTMDSMIGYKNDKYLYFGRAAARIDDAVNFIPSRISAYLMMLGCLLLGGEFDIKGAYRIHKRDSMKHASPNSAQTESTCAGALGIRLAGDASYFGKIVKKPFIGDDIRAIEPKDIKRANRLMYAASFICAALAAGIMFAVCIWMGR